MSTKYKITLKTITTTRPNQKKKDIQEEYYTKTTPNEYNKCEHKPEYTKSTTRIISNYRLDVKKELEKKMEDPKIQKEHKNDHKELNHYSAF